MAWPALPLSRQPIFPQPGSPICIQIVDPEGKIPEYCDLGRPGGIGFRQGPAPFGQAGQAQRGRHPVLSKAWFQLSADMSYVCLRIAPGLTEPIREDDVLALLRLSNCRRYQPLDEGIREAVTLLNTLTSTPDAPAHPPAPGERDHPPGAARPARRG